MKKTTWIPVLPLLILGTLASCRSELQSNQLPFSQYFLSDEFFSAFLANFLAGILIALVLYFVIDYRIQRQREKRAYRFLYMTLRRTVAKLDYLEIWLQEQKGESDRASEAIEIPSRLRSSVYSMWEKWRNPDTIQNFHPEFLAKFEMTIRETDRIFELLDMLNKQYRSVPIPEKYYDILEVLRLEMLEEILPILRKVRRKVGDIWVREKTWRQKLQQELVQVDEKYDSFRKKLEQPGPKSTNKQLDKAMKKLSEQYSTERRVDT